MSYFIFSKNLDNVTGTIYKIAENQNDLINLNITPSVYKIIEDSQSNFNLVKFRKKYPESYNQDTITYSDLNISFLNKDQLQNYINYFKQQIKQFIDNNPNHVFLNRWSDHNVQLSNLNLDNITYPLNKSLEQHFNDLGQTSLNPLQIS